MIHAKPFLVLCWGLDGFVLRGLCWTGCQRYSRLQRTDREAAGQDPPSVVLTLETVGLNLYSTAPVAPVVACIWVLDWWAAIGGRNPRQALVSLWCSEERASAVV